MDLPCLFVFLIFHARRACYSSCSAAISYGKFFFHSFAAAPVLVFLSLVCLSLPSPVPLNSAAITRDKPQVCVQKLHPIFLCPLFFSVVLHELSVLEAFPVVCVLLLEPSRFPLCEHWADCVEWLHGAAKPDDSLSGIQWVVMWLELQVSLHHHLGFTLQQWRCASKYFREKGVKDFTPQECCTLEIQFSKRILFFLKKHMGNAEGTIWNNTLDILPFACMQKC